MPGKLFSFVPAQAFGNDEFCHFLSVLICASIVVYFSSRNSKSEAFVTSETFFITMDWLFFNCLRYYLCLESKILIFIQLNHKIINGFSYELPTNIIVSILLSSNINKTKKKDSCTHFLPKTFNVLIYFLSKMTVAFK